MTVSAGPQDEFFDEPGWTWVRTDPPFTLRHRLQDGRIFCETAMTVPGKRDRAVQLLSGRWTWWRHGRATRFVAHADGSTDQVLSPVWWNTTRIGLHMMPPTASPFSQSAVRFPVTLSRHFVGPSTIDVVPEPTGLLTIRGRFHGIENHVPAVPAWLAALLHLSAESGTMPFPFPRGTGWRGLAAALARDAGER